MFQFRVFLELKSNLIIAPLFLEAKEKHLNTANINNFYAAFTFFYNIKFAYGKPVL